MYSLCHFSRPSRAWRRASSRLSARCQLISTRHLPRSATWPCRAADSSAKLHCVGRACSPSAVLAPIDSTPMPYLPASVMPDGLSIEATAAGISSWSGRIWSWASLRVNQSLSWLNLGSPRRRRVMTPMASSWRSRWVTGSMPNVWASDGRAPGPDPKITRPRVMWSSWTRRCATLKGWWYGREITPVPSRMLPVRSPAAARKSSGEAIISQPVEWCSPHQNSSMPSSSSSATSFRSLRNWSIGCSPIGWWGARKAPKRRRSMPGNLPGTLRRSRSSRPVGRSHRSGTGFGTSAVLNPQQFRWGAGPTPRRQAVPAGPTPSRQAV